MHLSHLTLRNYKNYSEWETPFMENINCITGLNGSGKTNILDAIYMLSFCKSHFQFTERNICFQANDYYLVKGQYKNASVDYTIECSYQEGSRKQVKFNGNSYKKLSEHIGTIPLVLITPQDILLIMEGSEERRRLLDMTIGQLDPIYLEKLSEYFKILEHRNKLLKSFNESPNLDRSSLELWNAQMIERGNYIYEIRKKHLIQLSPIVEQMYMQLSLSKESVNCIYQSKLNEVSYEKLLEESFAKDIVLERTTAGIHKDDLEFLMNRESIKKFGSQGQQKTFVFALKLAIHQYISQQKNTNPILLLDDLFEKLDEHRSEQLLSYISTQIKAQVFITDTHHERAKNILKPLANQTNFIQLS